MTYENAIQKLVAKIKEDYLEWMKRRAGADGLSDINLRMIKEFNSDFEVLEGRKYTKIVRNGSVWGFVVKGDDKKFKVGDILKPASWATPARNAARGNIFEDYQINWTGPNYLR